MLTLYLKIKSFFKEKQNEINKSKTQFETDLSLVDKINSSRFEHFNKKENSTLNLRSLYPKITIYIYKLKEINKFLGNDKVVFSGWCQEKEQSINVCDFFLDDKNQYIDEMKEVEELKILSIVFLSFYYEHSPLVEVGEHNTRVLTYFKQSLLNTISDLSTIA